MKAMILAGGVGSRLRPMTCACPKPMVPVLDRPVMEYAVRLLKKHGVEQIGVTVCYLPEQIRSHFGAGERFGVQMRYFPETQPLGTAGGVKQAQNFLDETFFVLSGDGLTDCDLSAALRFHREKKAMATIVLKSAGTPTEYGVAVTRPDGRIRSFLEKPDWSDVLSDRVNTGIYILEPEALRMAPEGVPVDFSRDLFPRLMQAGLGVYGYTMQGYWCDIGDVESYLAAHRAFLSGEIRLEAGFAPGMAWIDERAQVDGRAKIYGPCYIGPGAVVERDAQVYPGSVVGMGAHIGAGAKVKRAVIWSGAQLEEGAQASGCVLCDAATLEKGACAYEAAVLGSRSILQEGGALMPSVRVWPCKQIAEHSRVERDVIWGSGVGLHFRRGRLALQDAVQALRFGQILAGYAGNGPVLLAREHSAGAQACLQAVSAGLLSANARVLDAGGIALPVARFLCAQAHAGAAAYCMEGKILPLTGAGGEFPRAVIRKMEKEFAGERMPAALRDIDHMPLRLEGGAQLYLGDIAARFGETGPESAICRRPVALFAREEALLALAQQSFVRAGRVCRAEWEEELMNLGQGEVGVWLDADGALEKWQEGGACIQGEMCKMLLLWTALEAGERRVALPSGAAQAESELAEQYGAQVEPIHSGAGEEMEALAGRSPLLLRMRMDGVFAALCVLEALERRGMNLLDWQAAMPRTAVLTKVLPVGNESKGRVLRAFAQAYPEAELGDGVRIRAGGGRVWVRPSSDSAECMISCEAPDMEIAQDLLGEYAARVLRAARGEEDPERN